MGLLKDNKYLMDIKYPISIFQALGIGLSTLT